MEQWYTLHTKPNSEYQVASILREQGLQTYLPEIEVLTAQHRRQSKPFFPCYLFIKADLDVVGPSQVQWVPGMRRVVAFEEQPAPLSDDVISLIQQKLGEFKNGGNSLARHSFQPGDTVRITEGPFQDMLAIFEGPTTPTQRVQVLLKILGASRVEIAVADLEKVSGEAESPVAKQHPPRRTRGRGRQIAVCAN